MLTNLQLKKVYSTLDSNVAKDFYIPCLENSIIYKRVAGYFSAAALAYFSSGLEKLFENNGKYKLIISQEISLEDYELIKKGYELKEKQENLIEKIKSEYDLLENCQKKKFKNLAFLISIGLVDIKIGFGHSGLFHSKFGLFKDQNDNIVYFSGSNNETAASFERNFESFTTLESWESEKAFHETIEQENTFDCLWNNEITNSLIYIADFNNLIKSELVKFSDGKLILDDALVNDDSLILYMDKGNVFVANKLRNKELRGNSRHLTSLKNFLNEETIDFNSEVWNFKSNLTYKNIEYIIKQLKKLSRQQKIKLVIAESIYAFIDAQKFQIEEISKLGLRIKNKDKILLSHFEKFSEIVNLETSRPLRSIQMWVSYYMSKMKRVGNFSVPGAGKTAMIYGTYAYLSSPKIDEVERIVVIGPKNSFKSWKDEFLNVFGNKKKLSVLDIHSPEFNEVMLVQHLSNYNLFLFNYESINKYKDILLKLVDDKTLLVFDEVHRIKGIESKRAVDAIEIAQNTKYRFLLTGTPLPNSYQDLWNMLQILYMNEYQDYFNIEKHELKNMTENKIEVFNENFFPFYWRVTKKELGVPEAEPDNIVSVNMTKDEQEILNLLYRKYRGNPFVLYGRLIQFSSNPQLLKYNLERTLFETNDDYEELTFEYNKSMYDSPTFSNEEIALIDKVAESSKFIKAIHHSEQLIKDGRTIIIWCIFINTIEKVEKAMKEKGFRVAVIYGAIPAYERERIITDFQNGLYDVLITNPHTLGESVSLHKVSHDALYLEYSFNLTHMLQSRDRIHRLGLDENTKTNYYYFLLEGTDDFRNTIDRKIYDRLKDKEITMVNAVEKTHISIVDDFDEDKEIMKLLGDLK